MRSCHRRGLIVMRSGPFANSLRFLMPLSIEPADLEEGICVVEAAFDELR